MLFYRVDRFSRDALDYLLVRRDLLELGIKLRSVQEGFDDSPDGEMQEGLQAILAQWDNRKRSQRTKAGMREALARGRWPWGAPLGYCWRDKTLVPHPDRAPQVRLAFELAAAGSTVPEIRAELSRRGLSVPRSTIHRMLANPIYAGRLVAPAWGIDVEGTHEALVDWVTFRRANKAKAGGSVRAYLTGSTPDFPFRSLTGVPLMPGQRAGASRGRSLYHPA